MGCLKRYANSVDGSIPVQALLYPDEDLLSSQEGVGIYDGFEEVLGCSVSELPFYAEFLAGVFYDCDSNVPLFILPGVHGDHLS